MNRCCPQNPCPISMAPLPLPLLPCITGPLYLCASRPAPWRRRPVRTPCYAQRPSKHRYSNLNFTAGHGDDGKRMERAQAQSQPTPPTPPYEAHDIPTPTKSEPPPSPSSSTTPSISASNATSTTPSHFESLMADAVLPPAGPSYYAARRALWLEPPQEPPTPPSPSPSRVKLEALLNQPGAAESEEVWKAGLKNVWKGLVGGNQLRKRLPLNIVVRTYLLSRSHTPARSICTISPFFPF